MRGMRTKTNEVVFDIRQGVFFRITTQVQTVASLQQEIGEKCGLRALKAD